jgi:hypothetical protein
MPTIRRALPLREWVGCLRRTFPGAAPNAIALAMLGFLAWAPISSAAALSVNAPARLVVKADWQSPQSLPRRFRNHCAVDLRSGRTYCSDHCGFEYEFYYCAHASFGCCRVGFGYCDWSGLLRCAP